MPVGHWACFCVVSTNRAKIKDVFNRLYRFHGNLHCQGNVYCFFAGEININHANHKALAMYKE